MLGAGVTSSNEWIRRRILERNVPWKHAIWKGHVGTQGERACIAAGMAARVNLPEPPLNDVFLRYCRRLRPAGVVKVKLYKGNVTICGRKSPFSLYDKVRQCLLQGG